MKKRKLLVSALASLMTLVSCEPTSTQNNQPAVTHEHTYASAWSFNDEYHWHNASCEHTDATSNKVKHTFNDWSVVNEATIFSEGSKSRICYICGYEQFETIAKKDSKGKTINVPLSIDELIELSNTLENEELFIEELFVQGLLESYTVNSDQTYNLVFNNYNKEKAIFNVSNAFIDYSGLPQDKTIDDMLGRQIIIQGYVKKNVVYGNTSLLMGRTTFSSTGKVSFPIIVSADLGNTNIHEHTFETKWTYNETQHWHKATCEHANLNSEVGDHVFNEWIIDIEPTYSSGGHKYRLCDTCGYKQESDVPSLLRDGLTIESAYTPIEFAEICKNLPSSAVSSNEIYVKGTAKNCTYNSSYKSFSFDFEEYSDEDGSTVTVYSAVLDASLPGTKYDSSSLEGKLVTVYGYYKQYISSGPVKYEICYLSATSSPTGFATSPRIMAVQDSGTIEHTHTFSDAWSFDSVSHWHEATCGHTQVKDSLGYHDYSDWSVVTPASDTTTGLKKRTCKQCQYVQEEVIPKTGTDTDTSFTVYSFNDFHGAVNEYPSKNHIGLAKFGTYLKNASKQDNTLIIDSGDTFQGSIESNYNNGALITDVLNYAHVDVHTLGNHDFDWGESKIEANKARTASDGWHMTNLGGNIYDYNFATHTAGNVQQSRLGEEYYIKTLENGLKIGVIGVIGYNQITSICSPLVEDICFKDHTSYIQSLSDELRTEKGCDFVIASIHNGATSTMGKGLTDISSVSGKKYVDYVACGHSHANECYEENGVYYTQAASYGEMIYKSTFTVSNGEITNTTVEGLNYSDVTNAVSTIDPNITNIINTYAEDYSSVGGEILANINGKFGQSNEMPNLLAQAMYEEAENEGFDVDISLTNIARYDISNSSTMSYAQLYEAFPFDNVIYIVRCKGEKNVKELRTNHCYHDKSFTSMNNSTWYTAAVIDYLLWHTNSSRYYDYFDHSSENMQIIGTLKKANGDNYLYRDITADYLRKQEGTVYSSNYSNSGDCFISPAAN